MFNHQENVIKKQSFIFKVGWVYMTMLPERNNGYPFALKMMII